MSNSCSGSGEPNVGAAMSVALGAVMFFRRLGGSGSESLSSLSSVDCVPSAGRESSSDDDPAPRPNSSSVSPRAILSAASIAGSICLCVRVRARECSLRRLRAIKGAEFGALLHKTRF
jgi:hypothetical protein